MKIKIGSSFSGKISTGSYENMNPGFYAEVEFEIDERTSKPVGQLVEQHQQGLQKICFEQFKQVEQTAIVERITKERKSFRFYKQPNGKQAPSVTSIINFDADFYVDENELTQYASQSSITHAQISKYWETGKWVEPKEIKEILTDLLIIHKGSLKLQPLDFNFEGYLKKFPFKVKSWDKTVHNQKELYSGTLDYEGLSVEMLKLIPDPTGNNTFEVPTLCDAKRTVDKIKAFMQMAAYAKCDGMSHIVQLMAVPIKGETKQGFSKPETTTDIERYYQLFLDKRRDFLKRYRI